MVESGGRRQQAAAGDDLRLSLPRQRQRAGAGRRDAGPAQPAASARTTGASLRLSPTAEAAHKIPEPALAAANPSRPCCRWRCPGARRVSPTTPLVLPDS